MTGGPMTDKRIRTFGCRLNSFETEVIRARAGAGLDGSIVINSCAVTAEAVRQARQAARRARRENPEARIIVTGCAAQTEPETFAAMPEVDLVLGNEEKLKAESYAHPDGNFDSAKVSVGDIMAVRTHAPASVETLAGRTRAFVQVQTGCDHRCTFCIIPFGRGNSRSVPAAVVVSQVRKLVENGHLEVVLTGVDITAYGRDLAEDIGFGRLVRLILRDVPELKRLRLSSIDSVEVDEHLLRALAEEARLMPHLHLSLQSGDNMILKRMKRRHSREASIAFCKAARKLRPDVVFGADLIAGFPTESDEMFENSVRLVDQCGLTFLHVFPFSPRPGTPAALMPQLDRAVITARARRLRAIGAARLETHLAGELGQRRAVLMETGQTGRTEQFSTIEIDRPVAPGQIIEVEVTARDGARLRGRAA